MPYGIPDTPFYRKMIMKDNMIAIDPDSINCGLTNRERPMPVERYCPEKGCPGGDGCTNTHRIAGQPCVFEYVAAEGKSEYQWMGEGPPPRYWFAPDGTKVYRSYSDYVG